jgi:putative ABC transport system substrate-binding protein
MTRRLIALLVTLALSLLVAPLAAEQQRAERGYWIGFLGFGRPWGGYLLEAFHQGLREHGWIEGQNITIEYRWARDRPDRFPELAADLVREQVDVIVVSGGEPAIAAAKHATSTIPIVMAVSGDPVGAGLVASLARPGGNITGLSILSPELGGKRLELLKEAVPQASRVAVLWNAADPGKAREWHDTQAAARRLGMTLQSLEVRGPEDFDGALAAMTREPPDALVTLAEPLTLAYQGRIASFAAEHRLPMMAETREFTEAGGLMSYGASRAGLFRRAASYVDKILKGAKPADLPVEQPMKFELVINLKAAQALGLTIPPALLLLADEVIR